MLTEIRKRNEDAAKEHQQLLELKQKSDEQVALLQAKFEQELAAQIKKAEDAK